MIVRGYKKLTDEEAEWAHEQRDLHKRTHQWIADQLGVSQPAITNVLNGKSHRKAFANV